MKQFLHIGCGIAYKDKTTAVLRTDEWKEIRVDIDPEVKPDIVNSMLDMKDVEDESMDAVFSSHNIEHVYAHEVPLALKEFLRVLKQDGCIIIGCPNLKAVAALIAEDKLTESVGDSPAGPIAPIDMVYGYRPALQNGHYYMAHKCGFTSKVLAATLESVGFKKIAMRERAAPNFDLWAVAVKSDMPDSQLQELALAHFA